jgi:hypothetical protein
MSAEHPPLPAGIEQLLRMALVDPQLRDILLGEDPDAAVRAAQARGLVLGSTAEAVLRAIPAEQLRLTLEQLQIAAASPVPPSGDVTPLPFDGGPVSTGIRPDEPSRGIRPDLPEERPRGWWGRLFGK